MAELIHSALEIADAMLDEVYTQAYNCRCKVGGQDACSLDTDWLVSNLNAILVSLGAYSRIATGGVGDGND